eukprot:TRINITY_DN293_c0_g1_i1.p1 TRINITY_DN293_c0_g1~~TRINITY_DN293_c0_g1_i1.p1  ORF type:complete len:285 (-),score=24.15 TRINITY_DN293_c0_g1_i1:45-899(-)
MVNHGEFDMLRADSGLNQNHALIYFIILATFAIVRPILCNFFKGFAKRNIVAEKGKVVTAEDLWKFENTCWRLVNYSASAIIGVFVLFFDPFGPVWFWDPFSYFENYPNIPCTISLQLYYCYALAHYTYGTFSTLFLEPRQKDFVMMMSHHIVTLIIVTFSGLVGYYRVGAAVLTLTDISDPFLEAAKIQKYMGKYKVADSFFTLFGVIFVISRCFLYPYFVLRSSIWPNGEGTVAYYYICNAGLITLQVMFWNWSIIIVRMAIVLSKGEQLRDPRDDKEEKQE